MADYTLLCTNCGKSCNCTNGMYCDEASECKEIGDCTGLSCCPDPLPNSHLVANHCENVTPSFHCICRANRCTGSGTCTPHGYCEYDCDPPFVWNGSACVLPPSGSAGTCLVIFMEALVTVGIKLKKRYRKIINTIIK